MESVPADPPERNGSALAGWLVFCFTAAGTGFFVSMDGWYAGLAKPVWQPPSWVFSPVWTALYIMMAVAAWLVSRAGGWRRHWRPLGLFCLQWLLNALWTPLFFGLHRPDLALLDIVLLWLTLSLTVLMFFRVRALAGWLLVPYFAWVSFAVFLNYTLWRLNP